MCRVRVIVVLIGGLWLSAACSGGSAAAPTTTSSTTLVASSTTSNASVPTTTTAPIRPAPSVCLSTPRPVTLLEPPSSEAAALIELSQRVFDCATSVVLIDRRAPELLAEASTLARTLGAPMFPFDEARLDAEVLAEIERLGPRRIRVYGTLPGATLAALPGDVTHIPRPGIPRSPTTLTREVAAVLGATGAPRTLLMVRPDPARLSDLALVTPLAAAAGSDILAIDPASEQTRRELAALASTTEAVLDPDLAPLDRWRIEVALSGVELPGGGVEVFPHRRLLALYGNPLSSALGVLGEQEPPESLELLQEIIDTYQRVDQPPIQPAFEIIASVAAGSPTENGDFSRELSPDQLRPWIEFAVAADIFVILDLQPGRDDFLTQAKQYEEFLRLPNVGLALDPEWRLGPDELPLRRVGTVDADEVNEVVDWLAALVREHALPQKPLVLHQFQRRMLRNRPLIRTPPELAVVIHVDGQGSLASKYGTWGSILGQESAPEQTLWWGWKNFFDEDRPMARPDQVNELEPLPLVVTFQ